MYCARVLYSCIIKSTGVVLVALAARNLMHYIVQLLLPVGNSSAGMLQSRACTEHVHASAVPHDTLPLEHLHVIHP